MGQTLTHGVYLPDEGERNCYNGLAANWQILDSSVGTIAAHTAALAGKAPLVHTHTKADITDFPAYGTTAGTICEGNDSRLSDARTPVAHTHTKSDVTDLFNSANTWSAVNQYSREIQLAGDRNAYIAPMWSGAGSGIAFLVVDASKQFVFGQRTTDANNRSVYDATKGYLVLKTGEIGGGNYVEVIPYGSNTRLGDSTNKWKTLNGTNPGALSLPNLDSTKYDPIDFSQWNVSLGFGNTYVPQSDGWLYANIKDSPNYSIFVFSSSNPQYAASAYGNGSQGLDGRVALIMPVRAGVTYTFMVKASSVSDIYAVTFFPALGNV